MSATADVAQFPCPQCGADTKFKPGATEALVCEHCGAVVPIVSAGAPVVEHPLSAGMKAAQRATSLVPGGREVKCKTCGACTVATVAATRCAFCDSTVVVELTESDAAFLPESLLPFVVDKAGAQASWQTWMKSRWFAPNDLVSRSKRDGLDGCYLPYWTFDSDTVTRYTGERGVYYYETESYTDSQGKKATRQVRKTRWNYTSGTVNDTFDDVLVAAFESLPRPLVEKLEPWDLKQLRPFDHKYLAGFVAQRYSVDIEPGFELAKGRMEPTIRTTVKRDIGGDEQRISTIAVAYNNNTFKHLLLPLWISSFHYNEKVYRTIVNARTSEVAGERPYSVIKIVLFVMFMIALGVGIYFLITALKK